MARPIRAHPVEVRLFSERARFYNYVLAPLCFSLGMGAVTADAPRLYGVASLLFVLAVMVRHGTQYERVYSLWREKDHPLTRVRLVWRSFIPFHIAWGFLGAVALGFLSKQGLLGLS